MNNFYHDFTVRIGFPEEAVAFFDQTEKKIAKRKCLLKALEKTVHNYMYPEAHDMKKALNKCNRLAVLNGIHPYTLHMVFCIHCAPILKERYAQKGMDEAIFWETMQDLRYKLIECKNVKGVWGSFVAGWFSGFFEMNRFALGRFQYEHGGYDDEKPYTMACGITLKKGDKTIGFHIPSSGVSLTEEVRLASYKKAYAFYKDEFNGGPVIFSCGSWLLFPKHKEFLPKNSHILEFMDDFEIPFSNEKKDFHDAWRVFGSNCKKSPKKLPRNTALQRAYADWLIAGNKTGDGWGLIAFDGEKILR